jgi:TonB-dependent Receptor Plug Domain/Gram-negative bacterial TonB protein C-terminal
MGSRGMTRVLAAAAIAALAGMVARKADAQSTSTASSTAEPNKPTLTPPRAINAGVVPYPKGATGMAAVLVELLIDDEGHVSDVRLVSGAAPFVEPTMEAAWHWRFEPARRGDDAIAAHVRMRTDFTPPVVIRPPEAAMIRAVDPEVTEVTVKGHRPDPGQMTLGGGEVRQVPGAFGDAFRAIEALPGVVSMASGLPYFFIRGAPPGDTGYFIDGVRVPLLFHAAFGPSVIHPSLVDHVEFFPGGAPAQYGRFAGGIVAADIPPPAAVAHAEGSIRLFDAGALAETPFADGRGSALVAGRYSYSGPIVSAISPIQIAYWDYQARATWNLDAKNQIGVFAFGSSDDFGQIVNGVKDTILDGGFHRVDLRYDHALEDGTLRVASTLGYARSNNNYSNIRDLTGSVRAALEKRMSPTVTLRAGGDVTLDRYDLVGNSVPDALATAENDVLYPPHTDVALGAYADVVWQVTPRVQIVPGIRADLFTSHREDNLVAELASLNLQGPAITTSVLPAIDPRLATRVALTPKLALVSTAGIAQQPAAFIVPIPGLAFVEPNPTLQTAFQLSQGFVASLPWDVTLQATGFLNEYRNLTDLTATCPSVFGAGVLLGNAPGVLDSLCVTNPVRGQAFGGEFMLRRNLTKRLSGWVSYTLSRSTREGPRPNELSSKDTVTFVDAFDRTHVVSVVVAYDLGRRWRAGARFVAYTGLPYSNTRDFIPLAPYNDQRMPAFYRFDARLEKRWRLGERATIALVFEGMNVTLNKEVLGVHCAPTRGQSPNGVDTCTDQTLGPVAVPSVGVEGYF